MALFKLTKQDRDYYALQDLLKPKEEQQEETAGIGTKPSKQEQDEEGMFTSFFRGLFDRSEQRAQEIAKEARESALAARLTRELSGITKSLTEEDVAVRSASRDPRYGNQLPEETTLVDVTDTDMGKLTNVKPLYDLAEAVDPGTIDTESLDADGGASTSGKGLMSPRLDGKDGDLASYGDPFTVTEDELYKYATEAFPDNDLAAGALLATIEAESAGGDSMLESGNYTKEAALKVAYQGKYKTARKKEVEKIFKDPDLTYVDSDGNTRMTKEGQVKFFNIYYNDKYRGENYKMGNTEEGDGFRFRGRGPIQLTGKNNYKKYGDMIGVDLVQNPHLVVTDKDVALAVTKAYMKDKGLDKVTSASKLRNIVGHADDSSLTKAKARWKRAKEIENKIARSTSPRPMLRPDDFKVASN
jgi:predicted chitinase